MKPLQWPKGFIYGQILCSIVHCTAMVIDHVTADVYVQVSLITELEYRLEQ